MSNRVDTKTVCAVCILTWLVVLAAAPAHAVIDAQECHSRKLILSGKYVYCRVKAEAIAVRMQAAPDYTDCDTKLAEKWLDLEADAGGACPTNGDLPYIVLTA